MSLHPLNFTSALDKFLDLKANQSLFSSDREYLTQESGQWVVKKVGRFDSIKNVFKRKNNNFDQTIIRSFQNYLKTNSNNGLHELSSYIGSLKAKTDLMSQKKIELLIKYELNKSTFNNPNEAQVLIRNPTPRSSISVIIHDENEDSVVINDVDLEALRKEIEARVDHDYESDDEEFQISDNDSEESSEDGEELSMVSNSSSIEAENSPKAGLEIIIEESTLENEELGIEVEKNVIKKEAALKEAVLIDESENECEVENSECEKKTVLIDEHESDDEFECEKEEYAKEDDVDSDDEDENCKVVEKVEAEESAQIEVSSKEDEETQITFSIKEEPEIIKDKTEQSVQDRVFMDRDLKKENLQNLRFTPQTSVGDLTRDFDGTKDRERNYGKTRIHTAEDLNDEMFECFIQDLFQGADKKRDSSFILEYKKNAEINNNFLLNCLETLLDELWMEKEFDANIKKKFDSIMKDNNINNIISNTVINGLSILMAKLLKDQTSDFTTALKEWTELKSKLDEAGEEDIAVVQPRQVIKKILKPFIILEKDIDQDAYNKLS